MAFSVLVSAPYIQSSIHRFDDVFRSLGIEIILPEVRERLEESDLMRWIETIDGAICGDDRFTEKVLGQAKRLKVISKWGTGIDSIDQAAAKARGIAVLNTPDAFSQAVGDSVLGYMLCFARKLPEMTEGMRKGEWKKLPALTLAECTLGVVGVGNVGKQVVRRARAFGMKVLGNDIREVPADFVRATDLSVVSKEELLRESDFVSIHCDLNPTSHHLFGPSEFATMKKSAILINTARGPIVHEEALVHALREGLIGGAALDVFEVEPLPVTSPLLRMSNVMLAPHNANSSPRAWERVHRNTVLNLLRGLGIHDPEKYLERVR